MAYFINSLLQIEADFYAIVLAQLVQFVNGIEFLGKLLLFFLHVLECIDLLDIYIQTARQLIQNLTRL